MNIDNLFQSRLFRGIILTIVGLIVLGFVFNLGVFVGTRKADFSFKWADEYHRNFGGPQEGFLRDFIGMGQGFTNANGSFGQIIKIDGQKLTVKDRDNTEKIVLVGDKTSIVRQMTSIKLSDLTIDDTIVVIGEPNNAGQIEAKLIRVMPPAPTNLPTLNDRQSLKFRNN